MRWSPPADDPVEFRPSISAPSSPVAHRALRYAYGSRYLGEAPGRRGGVGRVGAGDGEGVDGRGRHRRHCGHDEVRIDQASAAVGEGCVGLVCDVAGAAGGAAFVEAATRRSAASTSSSPTPVDHRRGISRPRTSAAYPNAIALNLMSVVAMCKAAVPAMQEHGGGRVVAITSVAVRQPIPELILSNTAHAGATGFLKTLAREVAAGGVTVNSVQPGLHRQPGDDAVRRRGERDAHG